MKASYDIKEKFKCYLSHYGVLRESSTTIKLCVVFNGSQRTKSGESLNTHLLVGTNLLPALTDVLLRWRDGIGTAMYSSRTSRRCIDKFSFIRKIETTNAFFGGDLFKDRLTNKNKYINTMFAPLCATIFSLVLNARVLSPKYRSPICSFPALAHSWSLARSHVRRHAFGYLDSSHSGGFI